MLQRPHILSSFDKELSNINKNLIEMTKLVIEELQIALDYIKYSNQNAEHLIQEVEAKEVSINNLNQSTLDLCLRILALRSPVAQDLRYVFSCSHMSKILEQNGDSIKNAIKKSLADLVSKDPTLDNIVVSMIEKNIIMHNIALNAFIKKDRCLATIEKLNDNTVGEDFTDLCSLLLQKIQSNPEKLISFYEYLFLGKRLEVMGSRIATMRKFVTFIEIGKFPDDSSDEK